MSSCGCALASAPVVFTSLAGRETSQPGRDTKLSAFPGRHSRVGRAIAAAPPPPKRLRCRRKVPPVSGSKALYLVVQAKLPSYTRAACCPATDSRHGVC